MSDLDDVLEGKDVEEAVPQAAPEEAVSEEGNAKPEKPEPQEVVEEVSQPDTVPHARFHAVNEELKALKAQLAEKQEEPEERKAPDLSHLMVQPQQQAQLPDPLDDHAGFSQSLDQRMNGRLSEVEQRVVFNVSNRLAVQAHGQDAVNEAMGAFAEAARTQPVLQQMFQQADDPVGGAVHWYRTQQDLAAIQGAGGLEAYVKAQIEAQAVAPETPQPASPVLPSDMSEAGGVSRSAPVSDSLDDLLA